MAMAAWQLMATSGTSGQFQCAVVDLTPGSLHFTHRLEEAGVLTDCSIQTQEADETLDFDFCSANVINKIIMSAEGLREAFAELDMTSDSLEILLSPSSPFFRLTTSGFAGTTQVICHLFMWHVIWPLLSNLNLNLEICDVPSINSWRALQRSFGGLTRDNHYSTYGSTLVPRHPFLGLGMRLL